MRLRDKTIRGVRTTLLGTVIGALLQMLTLVVLARLLTPLDYGAYAGALIVIAPLSAAFLSTTERAIIIYGAVSEDTISSVLGTLLLLMSVLVVVAGSIGIVAACGLHSAVGSTLAAGVFVLPVSALAMTARATLRLHMAFDKLVLTDLVAQILGTCAVTIILALLGFGPLSLVFGTIAQTSIQAVGYRWGSFGLFRVRIKFAETRPVFRLSAMIAKISTLELVQGQIPSTFIGAMLGITPLGLFSRSYSLVQMPMELLSSAISRVIYSSFVCVREEKEKFVAALYQLLEVVTVIVFPIATGMAVAAPQLVAVVLGSRWRDTEPLIAWITLGGALTMTGNVFATVIESAMHLNAKFYGQLVSVLGGVILFAILTEYGLSQACIAFAAASSLCFLVQVIMAKHLLNLDVAAISLKMTPGLVSAAAVGLYIFGLQTLLPSYSPVPLLLLEISGSGALLAGLVAVFFPRLFHELLEYSGLRHRLSR